jgi:regulator of cell morphogenesis and NO signaling
MPEIEQSLHKSFLQEKHSFNLLFIKFFKEYKKEIVIHFKNEEKNLFPFCKVLANYSKTNSQENLIYLLENKNNVLNQLKNHQKNSEEINNLQRLLINYKVHSKKLSFFEVFLNQMSIFQKDLKIHAEIEDHVLTKKVLNLMDELDLKDV